MAISLLIAVAGFTWIREPRFAEPTNLNSILLWMPMLLVASLGQMFVIVTRGIDISIGSILAFAGISVGLVLKANPGLPVWAALGLGAAIGLALGAINGALVAFARISAIVVTIGTLTAYRGAAYLISQSSQIDSSMIPSSITDLSRQGIRLSQVTFSWMLVLALLLALSVACVLRFTQFGRDVLATGSNPDAAHLRGIRVPCIQFFAFCLCGACAGLAGVLYAARFAALNPGTAGVNFELNVIAAVAIGGVKINGGSGSVLGVLVGCLLLSCLNVALVILGVSADWQILAYGAVILVALAADGAVRLVSQNARPA